jgi:hypothetical protein
MIDFDKVRGFTIAEISSMPNTQINVWIALSLGFVWAVKKGSERQASLVDPTRATVNDKGGPGTLRPAALDEIPTEAEWNDSTARNFCRSEQEAWELLRELKAPTTPLIVQRAFSERLENILLSHSTVMDLPVMLALTPNAIAEAYLWAVGQKGA